MDLKLILLLAVVYIGADIATGACDIGWSEYKEDCIYFSHDRRRWHDAEADCRKRGGWLASDDNENKHDFIRTILNVLRNWNYHHYFLGATDYYFEGQYRWVETGRPVGPFIRWSQGQPSANATRNCLSLVWQNETNLVWQDDQCGDYAYYICEKLNMNNSTAPIIIG